MNNGLHRRARTTTRGQMASYLQRIVFTGLDPPGDRPCLVKNSIMKRSKSTHGQLHQLQDENVVALVIASTPTTEVLSTNK